MMTILKKLFPWLNRAEKREQAAMKAYLRNWEVEDSKRCEPRKAGQM